MEKLKLYNVTKASSDGSIELGDMVWLSENGDLNSTKYAGGWLSEDEWNVPGINDFQVEECKTHHLFVTDNLESIVKNCE